MYNRPVTTELVTETAPHLFAAEASTLGLKPGAWPKCLQTTLGNGLPFVGIRRRLNAEGETLHVRYRQSGGCSDLIVFND